MNHGDVAASFWGRAWCDHLESFGDEENSLPAGKAYVREGAVFELKAVPGKLTGLVAGEDLAMVTINVEPVGRKRWAEIADRCQGRIDSLEALHAGQVPEDVAEALLDRTNGLFPRPQEMLYHCSCPNETWFCEHVAALLYAVAVILDKDPDIVFRLRQADALELTSGESAPASQPEPEPIRPEPEAAPTEAAPEPEPEPAAPPQEAPAGKPGRRRVVPAAQPRPARIPATLRQAKPARVRVEPAPPARAARGPGRAGVAVSLGSASGPARLPRSLRPGDRVTASTLLANGVRLSIVRDWLSLGALVPEPEPGVYRVTVELRIALASMS